MLPPRSHCPQGVLFVLWSAMTWAGHVTFGEVPGRAVSGRRRCRVVRGVNSRWSRRRPRRM